LILEADTGKYLSGKELMIFLSCKAAIAACEALSPTICIIALHKYNDYRKIILNVDTIYYSITNMGRTNSFQNCTAKAVSSLTGVSSDAADASLQDTCALLR
jgi:hypothetical protein